MKRIISALGAAAIAAVIGLTSAAPSVAAPISPVKIDVSSPVEQVQYRDRDQRGPNYNRHRPRPRMERHHNRRGYWNGHQGRREMRRGYRRGPDGWFYPFSAFRGRR